MMDTKRDFMFDITGLKHIEEMLRKTRNELEAQVNRIAEIFLTIPDEEMYAEVLQVILEAMESKYGVFGYIDRKGALVCPSMTRDVWDQCRITNKDIVFTRDKWGGIWGRALKEKKAFYSNNPSQVPSGHIPISTNLSVPIIHQETVIGILNVADKIAGYDEKDQALLETIAGHIAPVLKARLERDIRDKERKHAEDALQRKHHIQSVLNTLLSLSIKPYGLEEILDHILAHIVSIPWITLESKGTIFLVEDDSDVLIMKSCRELPDRLKAMCTQIPFGRCLCGRAASTKTIQFADSLDECHENRYKGISPHGHYCVPILSSGKVLGVINLYVREGHRRDGEEEEFLQAIANVLAGIIERKRGEEELAEYRLHLEDLVKERSAKLVESNEQLGKEIAGHKRTEKALLESEQKLRSIFNNMQDVFYRTNKEGRVIWISPSAANMLGYRSTDELIGRDLTTIYAFPENREHFLKELSRKGKVTDYEVELKKHDGDTIFVSTNSNYYRDRNGEIAGIEGCCRDITKRREAEQELRKAHNELEIRVQERTAELETKTNNLKEVNTALRVMLKKKDEVKTEIEEKMVSNVNEQIMPYLEKLKRSELAVKYDACLNIIESNLNDITSSFSHKLTSRYLKLTPTEIRIASLIKHGNDTKEIAEILSLSYTTIQFHRRNIRNKLGIRNQKTNLRTHLLSLQ
jgi:PAS domain S-box-containing protein